MEDGRLWRRMKNERALRVGLALNSFGGERLIVWLVVTWVSLGNMLPERSGRQESIDRGG
ncbi:hypothetical protein EV356DRAFT_500012 [Viridothelium virens]|uniref:Uncharacterized protein n=1 Tax=Viridothelium virens TaxID=1048519 RepID=A0A6A6HPL7_VIRVR|nr:hypothetical protein EV356DRAFT_500012 [Viridothelium virens]